MTFSCFPCPDVSSYCELSLILSGTVVGYNCIENLALAFIASFLVFVMILRTCFILSAWVIMALFEERAFLRSIDNFA